MGIKATCANGHVLKVKDEFAGKTGLCPHCRGRVFVPMPIHNLEKARISDDEILGLLGKPAKAVPVAAEPVLESDSVLDACTTSLPIGHTADTGISLLGSSVVRKIKICPKCQHGTSVAFTHCPRCGTPLPNSGKPVM